MNAPAPLEIDGPETVNYGHSQVLVFDESEQAPGCLWDECHVRQGFARRAKTVSFGTLDHAGVAELRAFSGRPPDLQKFTRAISVPVHLPTGRIRVEGPEEYPLERVITVTPGDYAVELCQSWNSTGELLLELFLDRTEDAQCTILKADSQITAEGDLIDFAEPA